MDSRINIYGLSDFVLRTGVSDLIDIIRLFDRYYDRININYNLKCVLGLAV